MKQQLIQYVELLFAAVPDSEEMKQEILQNTLDRYDDLVSQGKSPEAAYRLAISGIGDISEILAGEPESPVQTVVQKEKNEEEIKEYKTMRAVAVAMYILCAVPLFIFSEFGLDTLGLCFTLIIVAAATALMILARKPGEEEEVRKNETAELTPRQERDKSINSLIWSIGLAVYLIVSFLTGAWHITWVIFLIIRCVQGLVRATQDLKEANENEN